MLKAVDLTTSTLALIVKQETLKIWSAAFTLSCMSAEDSTMAAEGRRHPVDVDDEETDLEGDDSALVVEGAAAGERKRKSEEKDEGVEKKRRRTTSPMKASTPAAPKSLVVTRAGRTVKPKKFFD